MMKKLLFFAFALFSVVVFGQQTLTFTTTSTSANWSPPIVTNSGATLRWIASGGGINETIDANDPTFDLSGNAGTVNITVESSDDFVGLTILWLNYLSVGNLDLSNAVALENLGLRGNRNLGTVDLTPFPNLIRFYSDVTDLTSIDLSTNDLLEIVRLNNNDFPSSELDDIVIDLDANGASNGQLFIAGQSTGEELTSNSFVAYNNLIGRGWTIDVPPPSGSDTTPPTIGVLNSADKCHNIRAYLGLDCGYRQCWV